MATLNVTDENFEKNILTKKNLSMLNIWLKKA